MRKNIFIALTACVALAACTKNELKPVVADQQITFQAVVNKPSTKAMIEGTTFATDSTFGTVAYKVNGSVSELYIPISEVKYNSTGSFWSTEAAYYWPKESESTLTFYSYSPYNYSESGTKTAIPVTSTKDGLTFTNYSVKDHQATDLMVADAKTDMTSNPNTTTSSWAAGVPTVFHHKLAQIVGINFQTVLNDANKDYANGHDGTTGNEYEAGDKQFVIKEVSLKNFYEQGTLTTSDDKWVTTGTATTEYKTTSSDVKLSGGAASTTSFYLVLPQTHDAEGAKLYVKYQILTYTDATHYATETLEATTPFATIHGTGAAWEMNKKYTYTLKMGLDRIYWDPTVTGWEPDSANATI